MIVMKSNKQIRTSVTLRIRPTSYYGCRLAVASVLYGEKECASALSVPWAGVMGGVKVSFPSLRDQQLLSKYTCTCKCFNSGDSSKVCRYTRIPRQARDLFFFFLMSKYHLADPI